MRKLSPVALAVLSLSTQAAHAADYVGIGVSSALPVVSYDHRLADPAPLPQGDALGFRAEYLPLASGMHVISGHAVGYVPLDPSASAFAGVGLSMVKGAAGPSVTVGVQFESGGMFARLGAVHSQVKNDVAVNAAALSIGWVF